MIFLVWKGMVFKRFSFERPAGGDVCGYKKISSCIVYGKNNLCHVQSFSVTSIPQSSHENTRDENFVLINRWRYDGHLFCTFCWKGRYYDSGHVRGNHPPLSELYRGPFRPNQVVWSNLTLQFLEKLQWDCCYLQTVIFLDVFLLIIR